MKTINYNMVWKILLNQDKDLIISTIKQYQRTQKRTFKVTDILYEEEREHFSLSINCASSLSTRKLKQSFQKDFISFVERELGSYKEVIDSVKEEKNWLFLTAACTLEENSRLNKLLSSIKDTTYYDVSHLYGPEPEMIRECLEGRKIAVIEWKDKVILLDEEGLNKKVNMNCSACTRKHAYGCCCGSPCSYSKRNLKVYKENEKALIEELKKIEPKFYQRIVAQELQEESPELLELVAFDGSIGECDGRCMLLVREEGMAKCLTHKYALEHQMPIYSLSPLSCLLFPLEIIEAITDKGKRLLIFTSVVEDEMAKKIGRWGSYKNLGISLNCMSETLSDEDFKKEDYQKVYKVNKGLITYEFGQSIYDAIEFMINEKKKAALEL